MCGDKFVLGNQLQITAHTGIYGLTHTDTNRSTNTYLISNNIPMCILNVYELASYACRVWIVSWQGEIVYSDCKVY